VTPKRSRLEIYLDILKTISKGTRKPTRIMYRTNLSWKPLMLALDSMILQGLISRNEQAKHTVYQISEKGRNVLSYFDKAMKLIEIE
jgi:predicted transcriptional regulator